MEATLVIKAKDLTTDYADGIMKVFSKDAILNITIQYDLGKRSNQENAQATTTNTGKKRGRKPKSTGEAVDTPEPKKRGPKPKTPGE